MSSENSRDSLCQPGKALELRLTVSTDNLLIATNTLQETCSGIDAAVRELRDYAIRDKGKIETLEDSRDCKNEKIKVLQNKMQEQAVTISGHLGEHKRQEKINKDAGTRAGMIGAVPTSGAIFVILEFLRHWITGES